MLIQWSSCFTCHFLLSLLAVSSHSSLVGIAVVVPTPADRFTLDEVGLSGGGWNQTTLLLSLFRSGRVLMKFVARNKWRIVCPCSNLGFAWQFGRFHARFISMGMACSKKWNKKIAFVTRYNNVIATENNYLIWQHEQERKSLKLLQQKLHARPKSV